MPFYSNKKILELGGNSSHPMDYTVAAIANVDNRGLERRDSNISMGPMRDAKSCTMD